MAVRWEGTHPLFGYIYINQFILCAKSIGTMKKDWNGQESRIRVNGNLPLTEYINSVGFLNELPGIMIG